MGDMLGHYKFKEDLKIGDLVSVVNNTSSDDNDVGYIEKLKLYNRLSSYSTLETNDGGETIIISTFSPSVGTLYELGMFRGEIKVGKSIYSRNDMTYFVRASLSTKDVIEPLWFLPLGDSPDLNFTYGGSIVSDNSNNIYVLASVPTFIRLRDRRQVGTKKTDKISVFYMHIQFVNDSPYINTLTSIDAISERDNLNITLDNDTNTNLYVSGMVNGGRKSYVANLLRNGNIKWETDIGFSDSPNNRSIISSLISSEGDLLHLGGLHGTASEEDQITTGPLYLVLNKSDGSVVSYDTGIITSSNNNLALSAITSMTLSSDGDHLYIASISTPGKISFMDKKIQVTRTSMIIYRIGLGEYSLVKYKKYPIADDEARIIAPEIVSTPVNGTTLHVAFYNRPHEVSLYHLNADMELLNNVNITGLSSGLSSSILSANKYQLFINGFNSKENGNTVINVVGNETIELLENHGITMMFVPDLPVVIGVIKAIGPKGMNNEVMATVLFQGRADGIFSDLRSNTQYYISMDGRYTTKSFNRSPILLTTQDGNGIFFGIRTARLQ